MHERDPSHEFEAYNPHQHQDKKELLRVAFSMPLLHAADAMDQFITRCGPEVINKLAHWHPVSGPIDYSVAGLSPFLFADQGNIPVTFHSVAEVEQHMAEFRQWHASTIGSQERLIPQFHEYWTGRDTYAVWEEHLKMRLGEPIDPAAWGRYVEEAKRQLQHGYYMLDRFSAHIGRPEMRAFNHRLGVFDMATNEHQSFMVASTSCTGSTVVQWNQLPVGAYDPEHKHTERVLRAAGLMMDFMEQDATLADLLDAYGQWGTNTDIAKVVHYHALRSQDATGAHKGVEVAQEGVQSISVDLLGQTDQLVPGYENAPGKLMDRIAKDQKIDKHALVVPQGYLGGLALFGVNVGDILDPQAGPNESRLRFGAEALRRHKLGQMIVDREMGREWHAYEADQAQGIVRQPPIRFSGRCPVAGPYRASANKDAATTTLYPSAIAQLTKVLVRLYHIIEPSSGYTQPGTKPWDFPRIDQLINEAYVSQLNA